MGGTRSFLQEFLSLFWRCFGQFNWRVEELASVLAWSYVITVFGGEGGPEAMDPLLIFLRVASMVGR